MNDRNRMLVELTSNYAISEYLLKVCEVDPNPLEGVLDTALCNKFSTDLWKVVGLQQVVRFPPPIKLTSISNL